MFTIKLLLLLLLVTFMNGIHNYIPETNHVSWVCNVADVLWLQYTVHIMLPWWMFCTSTIVLSGLCVHCPIWMASVLLLLLLFLLYRHNSFSPFSSSSRAATLTGQCDVSPRMFWSSEFLWILGTAFWKRNRPVARLQYEEMHSSNRHSET